MRFHSVLTGFLGAATLAVALESPHKRAPALVKREAVLTKDAPRKGNHSKFLTSKTASELASVSPSEPQPLLITTRICRKWQCVSTQATPYSNWQH